MNNYSIASTADGSLTLWDTSHGEHFHSCAGAYSESMHVFIRQGFQYVQQSFSGSYNILECGFGTGLNALLTLLSQGDAMVDYTGIEKYPLAEEIWRYLGYERLVSDGPLGMYEKIMDCRWDTVHCINEAFKLLKINADIVSYPFPEQYFHLIFFDAFSATVQPELWSGQVFTRLFNALRSGGVLVTYSARGSIKQAMRQAGFRIERLPGFGGKRHMIRAHKAV